MTVSFLFLDIDNSSSVWKPIDCIILEGIRNIKRKRKQIAQIRQFQHSFYGQNASVALRRKNRAKRYGFYGRPHGGILKICTLARSFYNALICFHSQSTRRRGIQNLETRGDKSDNILAVKLISREGSRAITHSRILSDFGVSNKPNSKIIDRHRKFIRVHDRGTTGRELLSATWYQHPSRSLFPKPSERARLIYNSSLISGELAALYGAAARETNENSLAFTR